MALAYKTVRTEIEAYGADLEKKHEVVVLSQVDSLNPETLKQKTKELKQASGRTPMQMSSVTHLGTDDVLRQMMRHIEAVKAVEEPEVEDPRWSQSGLDSTPRCPLTRLLERLQVRLTIPAASLLKSAARFWLIPIAALKNPG